MLERLVHADRLQLRTALAFQAQNGYGSLSAQRHAAPGNTGNCRVATDHRAVFKLKCFTPSQWRGSVPRQIGPQASMLGLKPRHEP
jgi:hypothetical protein